MFLRRCILIICLVWLLFIDVQFFIPLQREKEQNAVEKPLRIVIPSTRIDIGVAESVVRDGVWEVSQRLANHGMGTAYPGQKGNMVIFAHAKVGMFLPLKTIAKNDTVYILTKNKRYGYKVIEVKDVLPDQVDVVNPSKDERLTLFTCAGLADEKRLIVVAKPI